MRFSEFIIATQQAILDEWVVHARTLTPWASSMSVQQLEDHGRQLILAIAEDMEGPQTEALRAAKSKYDATPGATTAAAEHGLTRQVSGFDPMQMHGEFRALRASILRLWARSDLADTSPIGAEEIARFNEAVDQALAESVERYSAEVSRSRDMFLAVLGHDIRGPLSGIGMSASLLAKGEQPRASQLQIASRLYRACQSINHLANDLLEYTRSRLGGRIPVHVADCDLRAVCENALDAMRGSHPLRDFAQHLSGELRTPADEHRMAQVLWNLLDNAVNHGDPAKPVTFEAIGGPQSVAIKVSSLGEPIPADALGSIFEPMVRVVPEHVENARHPGSGLGLGLFIVQEIVRGHGGTVTVSSSEEQGTVFTVELPRAAA